MYNFDQGRMENGKKVLFHLHAGLEWWSKGELYLRNRISQLKGLISLRLQLSVWVALRQSILDTYKAEFEQPAHVQADLSLRCLYMLYKVPFAQTQLAGFLFYVP